MISKIVGLKVGGGGGGSVRADRRCGVLELWLHHIHKLNKGVMNNKGTTKAVSGSEGSGDGGSEEVGWG